MIEVDLHFSLDLHLPSEQHFRKGWIEMLSLSDR
jgi:hypothetical protein